MRVSAKAEYACIAVLELAASHGNPQPVRVKTIADSHGLSMRFLVQILLQLKGAGLVTSTRGASGGYHLTRSPDKISLADVIHVIDRPPPRKDTSLAPASPSLRVIRNVWQEIQAQELRILEEMTFADLGRQAQQMTSGLSYQI